MTFNAGEIIYKGFAPTIKMMICIGIGIVITKRNMFPPYCAKGVSILSLNVGLPALVFSSMVDAFTPQNITAFGPLVLVGVLYMLVGAILSYATKELFYVPADFQYGIIVMGILSNWGQPFVRVKV
ncbi:hypothetical protein BCR39DRAFT_50785 [Naematelia encephala]|uniref:Auxin efflux carrier n=1 Tax=Naematelia encephala TaxID=71784 RepID=A0A1Y2AGK2_9TREE|nr:hypothetical protein BCR39DRAFT_50785 [Naematelia encephala]